ncbi:hypothetical protein BDZ91DRAFT_798764 [Kalaharituber pfeilii]|nr:hypothetical protein BDZ91DRAFT_798764 [Kalaharituber pfeilii]
MPRRKGKNNRRKVSSQKLRGKGNDLSSSDVAPAAIPSSNVEVPLHTAPKAATDSPHVADNWEDLEKKFGVSAPRKETKWPIDPRTEAPFKYRRIILKVNNAPSPQVEAPSSEEKPAAPVQYTEAGPSLLPGHLLPPPNSNLQSTLQNSKASESSDDDSDSPITSSGTATPEFPSPKPKGPVFRTVSYYGEDGKYYVNRKVVEPDDEES